MGVQFNLLPDVKLEFDRQKRTKRNVYALSVLSCSVVLGIFLICFLFVNVVQRKALSDAGGDIAKYTNQLKEIPDLNKVLTIQNQLDTLPALHGSKHITSRFFDYLPKITPAKVYVGQAAIDLAANTITLTGTTDTLETVNGFVDTLKFTYYPLPGIADEDSCSHAGGRWDKDTKECNKLAFTTVILSSSSRSDKGASYTVAASFDPALFDSSQSITLHVPKETTTRSVTGSPDINSLLFNGDTGKPKDKQGEQ